MASDPLAEFNKIMDSWAIRQANKECWRAAQYRVAGIDYRAEFHNQLARNLFCL